MFTPSKLTMSNPDIPSRKEASVKVFNVYPCKGI